MNFARDHVFVPAVLTVLPHEEHVLDPVLALNNRVQEFFGTYPVYKYEEISQGQTQATVTVIDQVQFSQPLLHCVCNYPVQIIGIGDGKDQATAKRAAASLALQKDLTTIE